jgi:hypothetical protein
VLWNIVPHPFFVIWYWISSIILDFSWNSFYSLLDFAIFWLFCRKNLDIARQSDRIVDSFSIKDDFLLSVISAPQFLNPCSRDRIKDHLFLDICNEPVMSLTWISRAISLSTNRSDCHRLVWWFWPWYECWGTVPTELRHFARTAVTRIGFLSSHNFPIGMILFRSIHYFWVVLKMVR